MGLLERGNGDERLETRRIMTSTVCTLFEGHYHLGAAGLINSLWSSGFRGRILCGFRGALPPWAQPGRSEGSYTVRDLGEGLEVWFIPVETKIHFTNYKPTFLQATWDGPAGSPDKYFYFDPDIVVKCPWSLVETWSHGGIALCEDVNFYLPARHPQRLNWIDWLKKASLPEPAREMDRYYSAGFIGVPRAAREILESWENVIRAIGATTGDLSSLKAGKATSLFHTPDQDAMNIALMSSRVPINGAGWEAMDFAPGGHMLSHAIGGRKPWRGGFIRQALQGYPPSTAHKAFFDFIDRPIPVFTSGQRSRLKLALGLGAFIGRFYHRA